MRICRYCKEEKEENLFPKVGRRCKTCTAVLNKAYQEKNKEHIRKQNKEYRTEFNKRILVQKAKARARQKGLPFNITEDDIVIPKYCPLLGIPLISGIGLGKPLKNSPTLDRKDNSKGYTKDNIQIISYRANTIKNDASLHELERIAWNMKKELLFFTLKSGIVVNLESINFIRSSAPDRKYTVVTNSGNLIIDEDDFKSLISRLYADPGEEITIEPRQGSLFETTANPPPGDRFTYGSGKFG